MVFVNGEHYATKLASSHFYLGPPSDLIERSKQQYLPYVSVAVLSIPGATQTLTVGKIIRRTQHGAGFVGYLSSRCLPHREAIFDSLASLGKKLGTAATAGGSCHGVNAEYIRSEMDGDWLSGREFFETFKFGLALENTKAEGYVTEKILNVILGGAIPIYYGTDDIFSLFNRDRIIFIGDYKNVTKYLGQVEYLYGNPSAYEDMHNLPILASGAGEKYFWQGHTLARKIKNFAQN